MDQRNAQKKSWLTLHHSATEDGQTVSWGAIRKYHVEVNGWSAIGYNAGIELISDTYEVLLGRMPDQIGAHCRESHMNSLGIGICLVGDFDKEPPPDMMMKKLYELCRYFMATYNIPPNRVVGHREAQVMDPAVGRALKSCPGACFPLVELRRQLAL